MNRVHRTIELSSADDTGGKYVWSAPTKNARFLFYIPKWRVPDPPPELIKVYITDERTAWEGYKPLKPKVVECDPAVLEKPVIAKVRLSTSEHKETFRYDPFGVRGKLFEIGSPYIPMTLLPLKPPKILIVKVRWDLTTQGKFRITRLPRLR